MVYLDYVTLANRINFKSNNILYFTGEEEEEEEDDSSCGDFSENENSSSETLEVGERSPSPTKHADHLVRNRRLSLGAVPSRKGSMWPTPSRKGSMGNIATHKQATQKSTQHKSVKSDQGGMILKNKILTKRKLSDTKKTADRSVTNSKPKKVTMKSANGRKSSEHITGVLSMNGQIKSSKGTENGVKESKGRGGSLWGAVRNAKSRQSTTPDSGFQSDSPSFTNISPEVKTNGYIELLIFQVI